MYQSVKSVQVCFYPVPAELSLRSIPALGVDWNRGNSISVSCSALGVPLSGTL